MAKALVVDDSRAMRRFLGSTLTALGFEVNEMPDGEHALEALESSTDIFELMLLDWNMPGITGLEVLKKVRAEARYRQMMIVMVTSEVSGEQMARALLAGADDYVMKPFTEEIVIQKLEPAGNSRMKSRVIRGGDRIRVLVVDDSAVVRRTISSVLETDVAIEVAGTAATGPLALEKIPQLNPDIVTLDIQMPEMNGLEALKLIREKYPNLPVIMLSAFTAEGAEVTVEALALGANDYVMKTQGAKSFEDFSAGLASQLLPKIRQFFEFGQAADPWIEARAAEFKKAPRVAAQVVAIAVSTGGPNALAEILPAIPADFPIPILIVQHMPTMFTKILADRLNEKCKLEVMEAMHGMPIKRGQILIAPGNFHMRAVRDGDYTLVQLDQEPPQNSCRPSADVLFRSVATVWGAAALGVVLTGMGSDGCMGLRAMKAAGATIFAQDAETSIVWGMPGEVVRAGLADAVLPLQKIASEMISFQMSHSRNGHV